MNRQEYEDLIDAEAVNYTELNELQSNTSQVQFWKYVKKVIAFIAAYLHSLFQDHKDEVNGLIDTTETGHIDWYIKMIRSFQYGDQLVIINNVPTYEVIDPSKQIVDRVSYKEIDTGSGFKLEFKVAEEVNGILQPLNTDKLSSLSVYVNRRKIPGTWIDVLSLTPDVWKIQCMVTVDPLMYNLDGSLIASPTVFPINNGFESFFNNLSFGSHVYNSELTEHIMGIDGIIDFYILAGYIGHIPYLKGFEPYAGYVAISPSNIIDYEYA